MNSIVDWLNLSIKKIDHKLFKDVVKIESDDMKPLDDGQVIMFSDMGRITLTLLSSSGETKKIKAVIKTEAQSGAGKELATTFDSFNKEIKMYKEILKTMEKMMSKFGKKDLLWADCYYCEDNKFIFQDLCEDGYKTVATHNFLDLEHAVIAIKAIGQYHAMTMMLKESNYCFDSSFITPYYARKLPFMDSLHIRTLECLSKAIKENWGTEWESVPDRLMKYFEKPGDLLYNAWKSSRGKWDVLNHGDFTMRNLLFHYPSGSNHPDNVKFVDFQMCHYSNLASDLISLLYTSVKYTVRDENMDLLLSSYVESLTSTARISGYGGPIPTLDDVKSSLDTLKPLIISQFIVTIPFFIMSGKMDMQKKANELCGKFDTFDDIVTSQNENGGPDIINAFEDQDVLEFLKYELNKCIKEQIF